jgi:hypothetical protein
MMTQSQRGFPWVSMRTSKHDIAETAINVIAQHCNLPDSLHQVAS